MTTTREFVDATTLEITPRIGACTYSGYVGVFRTETMTRAWFGDDIPAWTFDHAIFTYVMSIANAL
jgi:hypothetical protein